MPRRRKSRGRRSYRRIRHHRMGIIGKTNKAIRQIGHGAARAAGPLMIAGGGLTLAYPAAYELFNSVKSKSFNAGSFEAAVVPNILPAAILIGAGIVTEKVVGAAVR